MKHTLRSAIAVLTVIVLGVPAYAGVPLTNSEGVGGIAFNPIAYTAGQPWEATEEEANDTFAPKNIFSKPQIGGWYISLSKSDIDWTTLGVAETLFKRLELSYGHEVVAIANADTRHKNDLGAKLLLIPENWNDTNYIPAVSFGVVGKTTSNVGLGVDARSQDYYVVATKMITQLPLPILVSGGALSTQGRVTGVLGYDDDRDTVGFGNINILPTANTTIGFEYKQGAEFSTFKNADYWQAHVGWFVNKNLTLALAYVNTGDRKSSTETGFSDGVVLGAHYQF